MTSQKTIERCRNRVKELELQNKELSESNKVLLDNNEKLSIELKKLRKSLDDSEITLKSRQMAYQVLQKEKDDCKQKCEIALKQKDAALSEAQRKAANIKHLSDIKWTKDMEGDTIVIRGKLP